MLNNAKLCWEGKKGRDMAKQRKKRGNGGYIETKKKKFCFLPVPRAAAAYGRQLKIFQKKIK